MCVSDTRRLLNGLLPRESVRCGLGGVHTEGDVIKDRIVEEHGFLADDAHKGTQVVGGKTTDIHVVDAHGTGLRVIEPR